jgi:hypothetical protein
MKNKGKVQLFIDEEAHNSVIFKLIIKFVR